MSEVTNETPDSVDYVVEEGTGTTGISLFKPLEAGRVKTLRISNDKFNIFFYRKGAHLAKKNEPLAFEREVPRGSSVRLYRSAPGRWAIAVKRSNTTQ